MKRVYKILLLATLVLGGCIKEDRDACFRSQSTLVRFKYEQGGVDVFGDNISSVNMFVFNAADGRFVLAQHINQISLNRLRGVELDLPKGQYRVVCFANVAQRTNYPNLTTSSVIDNISQTHLVNAVIDPVSGNFENGDRLFYAPRDYMDSFLISVSGQSAVEQTLYFRTAHVKVDVYVAGFEDQSNLSPLVELTNITPKYDFNLGVFGEPVEYKQIAKRVNIEGEQTETATFNVPLFAQDNNIDLIIRKKSDLQIVETINLKQFISAYYPDVDLTRSETVNIKIAIKYFNGNVSISIPTWNEDQIIPEM